VNGTSRINAIQYNSTISAELRALSIRGAGGIVSDCGSGPFEIERQPGLRVDQFAFRHRDSLEILGALCRDRPQQCVVGGRLDLPGVVVRQTLAEVRDERVVTFLAVVHLLRPRQPGQHVGRVEPRFARASTTITHIDPSPRYLPRWTHIPLRGPPAANHAS
jgi:hypothetical protein